MKLLRVSVLIVVLVVVLAECSARRSDDGAVKVGAERMSLYMPLIKGKRVALVVNHTSMVGHKHLIDTLLARGVNVVKIFTPEHGLKGNLDRGEDYQTDKLSYRGIPVISLIGKNKAPTASQLSDVDVIVYDIQDVGVRFFTYISTMYLVMNSAAENDKIFVVLDRPNPNGDYIDGPVLDTSRFRSFVGMLPIPVVYGLTPGELALMINGEGWLKAHKECKIRVIPIKNYTHHTKYIPPVKPSPNLPNYKSIRLYPSLCFFEATDFSVGRGTTFPFQVIGYPDPKFGTFTFVPHDIPGMQMNPIHEGEKCYGMDLRSVPDNVKFTLEFILYYYYLSGWKEKFFSRPHWFDLLAGTDQLRKQILAGWDEEQIRQSWRKDLDKFKHLSMKYVLY